jgi:hypothetical protein
MAASAIQGYPQGQGVLFENSWSGFTFSQLAPDVDIISIQPEYLGIPFAQFAQGPTLAPGDPWAAEMTSLASAAQQTGQPLMVQIVLTRAQLVGNAVYPDGQVEVQTYWAPACADLTTAPYATLEQSYINYALWVAQTFSPQYFVIMVEPNLYYANCGGDTPSWDLIVKIEQDVYNAVRAANPSMILFPTFNLETIYDQKADGFDQAQYDAVQGMKRDRLGLTSFPQFAGNPYNLPVDYYTRIPTINPNERPIVITETGWNSSSIDVSVPVFNLCASIYSDPSFESAFLSFLIYSAYQANFDVVTWWSDRDEMPSNVVSSCYQAATPPTFPECNNDVWCAAVNSARDFPPPGTPGDLGELAFKAFGTMGLRAYDGTPKDGLLSLWQQFQQLPIQSVPDLRK